MLLISLIGKRLSVQVVQSAKGNREPDLQMAVCTSADQFPVPCICTKCLGVKSGCSSTHKLGKLGLSRRTNNCSDAGIENLGVLIELEALVMPVQPAPRTGIQQAISSMVLTDCRPFMYGSH